MRTCRIEWLLFGLTCLAALTQSVSAGETVRLTKDAVFPLDDRQLNPRFVTWHPVEGEVVSLNPPRFRWPHVLDLSKLEARQPAGTSWTLQISTSRDFKHPSFEEKNSPVNFFNAIPPLESGQTYYWRVEERAPGGKPRWSETRSFFIAPEARVWDRSKLVDRTLWPREHPRLYWNRENWPEIKNLWKKDPVAKQAFEQIVDSAEGSLQSDWWKDFPKDDSDPNTSYFNLAKDVLLVALAHKLTGDDRFSGHRERMLQIASWGPGQGFSSPEGMPPTKQKWSTHLNEELALYYDWFYDELSVRERGVLLESLRWRLEHTLWSFVFARNGDQEIRGGNLPGRGSSHSFQNAMVSLTGCLAVWDEIPSAARGLEFLLHYLAGVTTPFGPEEGHNEGPGYGNGKTTWLADALWSVRTALPHSGIENLPQVNGLIDFFSRITPVGLEHSSFGNRAFDEEDWLSRRMSGDHLLGRLTRNGCAEVNGAASAQRLKEIGNRPSFYTPWTAYVIPYYSPSVPAACEDKSLARYWPIAGWVTTGTRSPSDYASWKENVGMVFASRPHGNYSHSFASDNAFDLFAYGEVLAHGGGGTQNGDRFAINSMSHNTVLINGVGQASEQEMVPWSARLLAFKETSDCVYFAGDASPAYPSKAGLQYFIRHVLVVKGKYFVIYDDLAAVPEQKSTWQWLYHLKPEGNLKIRQNEGFELQINDVHVKVWHLSQPQNLKIENRPGDRGRLNPITAEDYRIATERARGARITPEMMYAQHIWVSTIEPSVAHRFLSVLYPWQNGQVCGRVERISDSVVSVTTPEGDRDVISFGSPIPEASIWVDIEGIRAAALMEHRFSSK